MNESRRRALIIKFGAIGDVVMAIPAAHALHQRGYRIDWVCGEAVAPVLECYPWLNVIVADDRSILKGSIAQRLSTVAALWRVLCRKKYEVCATLYYDPRYKLLAVPVRARRKVTLSRTERKNRLLPGRHHTDEYARILLEVEDGEQPVALSPVRAEHLPESPMPPCNGTRVLLAPAGAKNMMRDDALRRWPVENYVAVARELLARGMQVVLIGGPEDAWAVPCFSGVAVSDLIGKLTLLQTLALLDASDVLVTHDTGPLHLAGITSVGIVSIFGPTDPRGRLPQRANTLAIWGGEGFACRPCYDGFEFAPCKENGCMRQVSPGMVVDQTEAVISQRRGLPRPPQIITPVSTVTRS